MVPAAVTSVVSAAETVIAAGNAAGDAKMQGSTVRLAAAVARIRFNCSFIMWVTFSFLFVVFGELG
ncbi:MAG TPA: hypothetical protein DCG49_08850 [Ruminococcus sp.]|nr:hypothetical protein [Ruminococcus sp.]